MASGWSSRYLGSARPKKKVKPMMKRFLDELRSTNCRLEMPTAVIMPVVTTTMTKHALHNAAVLYQHVADNASTNITMYGEDHIAFDV